MEQQNGRFFILSILLQLNALSGVLTSMALMKMTPTVRTPGTFVFVFHSCLGVKHCLQWLTEKRLFNVNGALTRLAIRREREREGERERERERERGREAGASHVAAAAAAGEKYHNVNVADSETGQRAHM